MPWLENMRSEALAPLTPESSASIVRVSAAILSPTIFIRSTSDHKSRARLVGYATWIRIAADTIGDRPELAAEQLDEAGALPPGERTDRLGRADAGDGE